MVQKAVVPLDSGYRNGNIAEINSSCHEDREVSLASCTFYKMSVFLH